MEEKKTAPYMTTNLKEYKSFFYFSCLQLFDHGNLQGIILTKPWHCKKTLVKWAEYLGTFSDLMNLI